MTAERDGSGPGTSTDDEPTGTAAGYQPVDFCHGCQVNREVGMDCPLGHRIERMLVDPDHGTRIGPCRRRQVLAAGRVVA